MPYTKQDLQTLYSLSPEDVTHTLTAAKLLLDKETYTDSEIQSGFDIIRGYFTSGQAPDYTMAAQLFNQNVEVIQPQKDPQAKTKKQGKALKSVKPLDISFLLTQACEQSGRSISLTEALKILQACGLPDTEQYTQTECDRFLEACDLIKQQGKTEDEVAAHFGCFCGEAESEILNDVDDVADMMEQNICAVTDEMLQQRAEAQALSDAQKYMHHYVQAVKEGQAVQDFWTRLREHSKARLSGKPQARLKRAEPQTTLILPSSPNSTNSSETSENGTTNE